MNRDEIKNILPHREPMLLVDQVELAEGKSRGKYQVRGDEFFLQGHFPGNPVVPGVIQCEMLAQSAAMHPDELVFALLASGFSAKCYDGKPFFSDAHQVGKNIASNIITNNPKQRPLIGRCTQI